MCWIAYLEVVRRTAHKVVTLMTHTYLTAGYFRLDLFRVDTSSEDYLGRGRAMPEQKSRPNR